MRKDARLTSEGALSLRSVAVAVISVLVVGLLSLGGALPATAAPVYEITGGWAEGTPDVISTGEIATAEWRINVNDDAEAPSNDPVDNVTATIRAANGIFSGIPDSCLTTGVTPPSSISSDGTVLVCNFGTKDQGTSIVLQTTIEATGSNGTQLSADGEVIGDSTSVTPIDVDNPFFMDLTWGVPTAGATKNNATDTTDLPFQWSLLLGAGSDAGPDTVTYTIQASTTSGASMVVGPGACSTFTDGIANGHPWSGGSHPADQTGPFVQSCSFVKTGATTFTLTLSGIDYTAVNAAAKDSAGDAFSPSVDVIATGQIMLRVNSVDATTTVITSNAPTYTSVAGDTVTDDTSNNTARKVTTSFGRFATTWVRSHTNSGGSNWDDTYRVAPGTEVRANAVTGLGVIDDGVATPNSRYGLCVILDSKYVTYDRAEYSIDPTGITMEYYVGSSVLVNGASASYDPNAFTCNEGGRDVGATGWTTVEPADKSTVKAVRAQIPFQRLDHTTNTGLAVYQTIKPDVAAGQDIWEWGAYRAGGAAWDDAQTTPVTTTPGARYPNTVGGERDILRVSALQPYVTKDADRSLAQPGQTVTYTLDYQVTGRTSTGTADGLRIVDTLPIGMAYITGSSTPAPVVSTNGDGQQVLTWTIDGVETGTLYSLTYQASVDSGVDPGTTLTNSVTAAIGGVTTSPVTEDVRVPSDGYTSIGKTADSPFISNTDGNGDGTGSWTVTLRSFDPYPQDFTDTIDILPYVGDGRGTDFSGDYVVTDVDTVAGATVYYTTASPGSLSDDPADASNGSAGSTTGNTVGWTTTKPENPTAVRVIGPSLAPGATQSFSVGIQTDGAEGGDVLVNRAQARAEHTELVMRTSAPITVANYYSASLKKYVQDSDGEWHDANTVEDYPAFHVGDDVTYRIVATNTGQGTLENVEISDSLFPEGAFTIDELAPGDSETHEYTITLDDEAGTVVNTASATSDTPPDSDTPPVIPSDPAGIEVSNYTTAKSSDPASGETVHPGDTITYTIAVTQEGTAPAEAEFTDTLVDVSDDAVYNGDLEASIGEVTLDGDLISWTGTVPVGEVALITYSVTVKDSAALADEGDYLLGNSVVSPGCEDDCSTEHPVADYGVVKTSDPESGSTVAIGDSIDYTITVTQIGEAGYDGAALTDDLTDVLDDADWDDTLEADAGEVEFDSASRTLSWTGDLAVGDVVTITYSVTVTGEGDSVLDNVVTSDGCADEADCTTEHFAPHVVPSKSVDPASGTAVSAGQVLTYTLTFMNDGEAAGEVDYTDYLADILDDASVTGNPVSSVGSLSATLDGDTILVSGTLDAGQTGTITYEVTVGADGERGNNHLGNFLVPGEEEPPTECVEGSTLCTENPIGELHDWKSVEANESPVAAGTELTYTLHFENRGEGTVDVDRIDFLTHVLDDADVTAEPTSDTLTVSRDGEQISITGSLGAGESATVVYTVTVKADGERGDSIASNFLVPNDPEYPPTPPTDPVCQPTDAQEPDCTETPIGRLTTGKSVEASSDPIVAGTTLTYTLTFDNQSEAAATVDHVDDLSGVLDDADVTTLPVSSDDALTVSPIIDGSLSITGELAPGQAVTVTYVVTVKDEADRGDNVADNFLVPRGETPPEECVEGDPNCTVTPLPNVDAAKSVDPASGSSVAAGDVLTYTLTFVNDGNATGTVDYTDYLADIVDDATVTGAPESSDAAVSAVIDGDTIVIAGPIAAGATVTVTYQVTVGADGERGNNHLGNFLVPGEEEPPTECVEGSTLCTENPIGELHDWKSVEANESPVAAGTELTYTLHFENRGEGTVDVDRIDFLTHVLDDADVTAEPTSDTLTVSRDGETISITGSLEPGQSATVVYTVTVKADGARGDDTAANFLVPNDPEDPPTPPTDPVCEPTDTQEPDCTETPIGRLDTSKSVSASTDPVETGTELTYTLTFENPSEADVVVDKVDVLTGVLDDATVTTEPQASDDALTATRDGELITITGQLAAGQTVTVTYVVTVNDGADRGDNVADNFLLNPGEEPPAECVEGDENCTSTPLPNVDSSKSVDPASGSTVLPGDALTYTLTLTNSGEAAGAIDRIDYLAGVLDDAEWTDGPTVSDPSVTAVLDGTELTIGGTLQPSQTVTVTYTVTVLPDADRGDDVLTNFLFTPDEEPPGPDTECEDGDPDCTQNPVPRIVDWKSADPVSGTPVTAGQVVTYTLHFRNDGAAAGALAKDDVLTGVLDDADITSPPVASTDSLMVSDVVDGRFTISGSLEAGETATVTYSVTVRPFAEQGDHLLDNWLVLPGDPPGEPGSCEPAAVEETDCTEHPIGEIAATKSVDPETGTEVEQGQVLRYTLTFTGTGAGAAVVDYTDHLGDVFDDAALTSGPSSDTGSVEVELSGDTLTVVGSLAAGATATVTYSVTVKAYDRQGNHRLDNFLGLSGSTPQERCVAADPLCTSNPVSPPPPLAITGGEIGMAALTLMVVLLLGGIVALEMSRRRRLLVDATEADGFREDMN